PKPSRPPTTAQDRSGYTLLQGLRTLGYQPSLWQRATSNVAPSCRPGPPEGRPGAPPPPGSTLMSTASRWIAARSPQTTSYGDPEFVKRGYYVDVRFTCQQCGETQIWTAQQQ